MSAVKEYSGRSLIARVAVSMIAAIAITATGGPFAQSTDPAVVGQWSPRITLPIVPLHSSVLTTGQVLMYDSTTDSSTPPRLFYPSTLTTVPVPYKDSPNLFCSDHAPLTDGRIFVVGGHAGTYAGINGATIFDPATNLWTDEEPMSYARWYPSLIKLSDGRMLVVSGAISCPDCINPNGSHLGIADLPEIYDPRDGTWTTIATASLRLPLYPHLYLLPDGRVFAAASQEDPIVSQVLSLSTGTWSAVDSPKKADGGSSVLYGPGKIMKCGSGRNPDYNTANASTNTYVIDMNQASPSWRQTASMANRRTQHNLVLLPDGTVLAVGGGANSNVNDLASAVNAAELWDPATETWSTMASAQVPRLYHSVALLLPDGRVFAGGGGHPPGFGVEQLDAEIYSPSYLFKGARPTITSAPSLVDYGGSFFLQTPDAAGIASVSLIAQPSVTHGFNTNQRYLSLSFTQAAGGLTVTAPANANLAPPGYYMMFVVNGAGVPSLAAWIRLPAFWEDAISPTAPTNLVATVSTGRADLTWGTATDNIGVAGYDVHRSTISGFSPGPANRIAQTVSRGYSDQGMNSGTYYYQVVARDAVGNLGPASNEAPATVVADTSPPEAPAGLIVANAGPGQISLYWGTAPDDVGVKDYFVDRCTGVGCTGFSQIGTTTGVVFDDIGLSAGTTYEYRVRAEDARGNLGAYSDVVAGTTTAASGGLVAAWGFNEGKGATTADVSGFVNSGSLGGAGWTAQGKFGSALTFDGATSKVTVADTASIDLTSGMTIEAWVKPGVPPLSWHAVVAKDVDRYYLMAGTNNQNLPGVGITFGTTTQGVFGTATLPVGAWTHLSATYDRAMIRLYANGTQVATGAQTALMSTSNAVLTIGADFYGEFFEGVLDEIRIYNRALSVSEIQKDMNTPAQGGVVQFSVGRDLQSGAVVLTWVDSALAGTYRVRRATGPTPADFAAATCWVVQGTTFSDPAPQNNGISYDYLVDAGSSCP